MKPSREQKTTFINHTTAESVGEMITTVTSFLLLLSLTSFFLLHSFTQSLIPDLTVFPFFYPPRLLPVVRNHSKCFMLSLLCVCGESCDYSGLTFALVSINSHCGTQLRHVATFLSERSLISVHCLQPMTDSTTDHPENS